MGLGSKENKQQEVGGGGRGLVGVDGRQLNKCTFKFTEVCEFHCLAPIISPVINHMMGGGASWRYFEHYVTF